MNKAIPIATEHGLEILRSNGLLGMALVETELGDIERAEKYLLEIIDTFT